MNENLSQSNIKSTDRMYFLDLVRILAMFSVILYHAVAAYSTMTPWWTVHDNSIAFADFIRQVFDVYMMPVFFFLAGYFTLSSLKRRGTGSFLGDKLYRLGIPWLLIMMTLIPLSIYSLKYPEGGTIPFWKYYFRDYIGSFGRVKNSMIPAGEITQMHFWYISLLLAFFIIIAVIYRFSKGLKRDFSAQTASSAAITKVLLLFGLLCAVLGFILMLVFSDLSWITVNLLLQFQPTKVCIYVLSFALGIYAETKHWFSNKSFWGHPGFWAIVSVLITVLYLLIGRQVFPHIENSQDLSPLLLFAFSAVRSFLLIAILILLLSFAMKYTNRKISFVQKLSANSFQIYLVHFIFIIMLQDMLVALQCSSVIKILIILIITIPASYVCSLLINKFPRIISFLFVGLLILSLVMKH